MSLYNLLFGENEDSAALLGMISCNKNMFMRYRDIYLNKEGTKIIVLTRVGGYNRKDYKQVFSNVKRNKYFIRDYDDKFDNTYCYFEFKVPEKYASTCKQIAPKEDVLSVGDKFKKEIKDSEIPGSDAEKRMAMIADRIFNSDNKPDKDGITYIGL